MKKLLSLLVALSLAIIALTGCGNSSSSSNDSNGEWEWERSIEIVCPWGSGGGADSTLRAFAASLEKELGVSVVVNNISGAGGITGVEYATSQPADGYTWVLATPSPLLAQISGATDVDVYGKLVPVAKLVHDTNIFVTSSKAPFNNYEELSKYIDANPGKVKCGVMSITGLDYASVVTAFDGRVEAVAYSEGAQLNSDVIGEHISLACVGPAEVLGMLQSGDMKAITVCSEERMTMPELKDVECTGELNIDSFYGPYRAIFAVEGTPEAAIKAFEAAAEKAVASKEFQEWAKSQGLDQRPGWANQADLKALWDEDYDSLTELLKKLNK